MADSQLESQSSLFPYSIDDVCNYLGFSRYQKYCFLFAGFSWMADSLVVLLIQLIGKLAQCGLGSKEQVQQNLIGYLFIGMLFGAYFFGFVSDLYGRKLGNLVVISWIIVSLVLAAICSFSVQILYAFGVLIGFGTGGLHVVFTLFLEITPERSRGRFLVLMQGFWAFGGCLEAVLAYIFIPRSTKNGWKLLILCSAVPLVGLLFMNPWVFESPKYLYANKKYQQALDIVLKIKEMNKKNIPSYVLESVFYSKIRKQQQDLAVEQPPPQQDSVGKDSLQQKDAIDAGEKDRLIGSEPQTSQNNGDQTNNSSDSNNKTNNNNNNNNNNNSSNGLVVRNGKSKVGRALLQLKLKFARYGRGYKNMLKDGYREFMLFLRTVTKGYMKWTLLLISIIWFCQAVSYYGLVQLSTVLNASNKEVFPCKSNGGVEWTNYDFIQILVNSVAELPGILLAMFLLQVTTRKLSYFVCTFLCFVSLALLSYFTTSTNQLLVTSLMMCGRGCAFAAFAVLYIYTPEMFPTKIRSQSLGLCILIARIGGYVSPQIAVTLTITKNRHLGAAVMSALTFVGMLCIIPVKKHKRDVDEDS